MPPPLVRMFTLTLSLLCSSLAASPPGSPVRLDVVASLDTAGCAGFKYAFVDGNHLLVAANFWDGVSRDMGADSLVYRIAEPPPAGTPPPKVEGGGFRLALTEVQRVHGKGAHGADAFTLRGEHYLVIPSYYGCGSAQGIRARDSDACKSTLVLRYDQRSGGANLGTFVEHQRLATSGPAQTVHFSTDDGTLFVAVGENFGHEVCIYRADNGTDGTTLALARQQCLAVPGAGSMAVAKVGSELVLVASSYHDPKTGWATRSRVFTADARSRAHHLRFAALERQPVIDTNGCHDVELARVGGGERGEQLLLFLSEDRSPTGSRVESSLLVWDPNFRKFELHQRIPTDGAHGARLFEGPDGAAYVVAALLSSVGCCLQSAVTH
jgi:hypothetical protein